MNSQVSGQTDELSTVFSQLVKASRNTKTNLETWVLFVDLVKAFDTAPRDARFAVLRR
jgi:quinol monooxygenase YgiN